MKSVFTLVRHHDIIQPFMLHNSVMRGRLVRLDNVLNAILSRHAYHDVVAKYLAEMLMLGAMLSSNLPEGGILTLQVKGNGAVSLMVVDVQHDGSIRGYANMSEASLNALNEIAKTSSHPRVEDVFGTGYLAITLDTSRGEPYQGIVPLEGESLADAVTHYFTQSQQLEVMFHHCVSRRMDTEGKPHWIAAGIMLERMPEFAAHSMPPTMLDGEGAENNNWNYQSLVVRTASEEELSDPFLAPSALLYRLFNEGGVWVYDTQAMYDQCRCSREKITRVLSSISVSELKDMCVDGVISVQCQFCSREEVFTPDEV